MSKITGRRFIAITRKYKPDVTSPIVAKANFAQKISITINEKMDIQRKILFVIVVFIMLMG